MIDQLEDVDGSETFYYVDEDKKRELEYYKNSIIHCFIAHSFVAVSLLTGTEEIRREEAIREDYGFLKNIFIKLCPPGDAYLNAPIAVTVLLKNYILIKTISEKEVSIMSSKS